MYPNLLHLVGNGQVVKAAQGRVPVFLDGGVRRGTDVFKALALGASGVFVSKQIMQDYRFRLKILLFGVTYHVVWPSFTFPPPYHTGK